MRKIVAFLLMMLIGVVCSTSTYAFDPATKSSKQRYNERVMGSLAEQLRAAMAYNATHAKKKYYIKDDKNARFFYSFFTSDNASDLIDEDYKKMKMSHEYDWNVNKYIQELRDKYLPEKYKDYQIYFMVGGLFYTPDIVHSSRHEQKLDWKTLRSISFDNVQAAKPEVPYAADPAKEQTVRSEFFKKVNSVIYDTVLKWNDASIVVTEKTIIIYKWLLFDFDIKDQTLESYLKDYTLDWKAMLKASPIQPVLFMSDGFLYKKKTPELVELETFLESDNDYSDIISLDNMTYQRNKLYKDIANAFIYFYQKEKPLIPDNLCNRSDEEKEKILGVLAQSYKKSPTGNWGTTPFRNTVLYQNIDWDSRKCVLDYLLNKTNCNDAKGVWFNNACENMLVDVIGATKREDQKKLLDYFNNAANYKKAYEKIDDANGDDNYTGIVFAFAGLAASNGYWDDSKGNPISEALFDFHNTAKRVNDYTTQITVFDQSAESAGLHFKISRPEYMPLSAAAGAVKVAESTDLFDCTPFTPVQFVYSDDLEFTVKKVDGTTPLIGEVVTVPALYLQWLIRTDFKMSTIKTGQTILLVGGLVSGVGSFATATTTAARVWAAADVIFTSAALLSNESGFRNYVNQRWPDHGLEVLGMVNTLGMWFGGAYLGKGAINYLSVKLEQKAFRETIRQMTNDAELARRYGKETQAVRDVANELDRTGIRPLENGLEKASDWASILSENSKLEAYIKALRADPSLRKLSQYLTAEEEAVIKFYTTNEGYYKFNQALRGEIPMTEFFTKYEAALNQALSKLPDYAEQALLWRGLKAMDLDKVKELYKVGQVVTENGFVSCAHNVYDFINSSRARNFNVIIKIKGKSGKLIQEASTFPAEAEVLIKSKTKFEVIEAKMEFHPDRQYVENNGIIFTIILKEL